MNESFDTLIMPIHLCGFVGTARPCYMAQMVSSNAAKMTGISYAPYFVRTASKKNSASIATRVPCVISKKQRYECVVFAEDDCVTNQRWKIPAAID